MNKHKKKNIIITGGSGNLGRVVVERLVADGYHIITTMTPGGESPFQKLPEVDSFSLELTDEKAVEIFVHDCVAKYGDIDAAILIAGGFAMGNLKDTDEHALHHMLNINFGTAYHIARHLYIHMEQSGGHIIFVGSRPAFTPSQGKNVLGYALSKSLLFRMAEIINEEGRDHGVRASVIVPGTIDTPANRDAMPEADFSKWVKRTDIAAAFSYLVSEPGGSLRETVLKLYNES